MTKAPIEPTVAATAFVSGLSRWYGDGAAGARPARKAASVAVRAWAPPGFVRSIG
ncbi:MAG: hypothetical protein QOE42_2723 [Chloroflexota bacterium]|jgi:hypothetical protein|nr:hypothetical protein [Chloroflexota bacterium]